MKYILILLLFGFTMCNSDILPGQDFSGSFIGNQNGISSAALLSVKNKELTGTIILNGKLARVTGTINDSLCVGTFYEASAPGTDPFVKIGDQVEAGQVICIVEAMKLMNEIECDAAGEIVKRMVTTGQPVEYGQPLFAIRLR